MIFEMFQYTYTTFTPPIIFLECFVIQNCFFFLEALTKKKCAQSKVSIHKIGPNGPIRQAETTSKLRQKLMHFTNHGNMHICGIFQHLQELHRAITWLNLRNSISTFCYKMLSLFTTLTQCWIYLGNPNYPYLEG